MRIHAAMPLHIQASAAKPVAFSGYHPDAAIGVSFKVAGIKQYSDTTKNLFFRLRSLGKLSQDYATAAPMTLQREPDNQHDPNAITILTPANSTMPNQKVGYVPRELAARIAPLMDAGHQFHGTLTNIKPFAQGRGSDKKFYHAMVVRMEYVTPNGQTPDAKVLKQVEKAFKEAKQEGQYDRVVDLVPETFKKHRAGRHRLMEKVDRERQEVSFYLKDQLLTRVKVDTDLRPLATPTLNQPLSERMEKKVANLLNRQA